MHPWICAGLIAAAGASGGLVNAMLSEEGLARPKTVKGVWCPGALSTIVIGALAAFASWAFYGSGAGIDLAEPTKQAHLQLSALAGAFLVGVVGAKWIQNETAKRLFRETVKVAAPLIMPKEKADNIPYDSPSRVLQEVAETCESCQPYVGSLPGRPASA